MLSQIHRLAQIRAHRTKKEKNVHQTPKALETILPLGLQTLSCRSCWYRIGELVWVILDKGSSSIPTWPGIIVAATPKVSLVCPQVVATSSGGHKEHWDLGSIFMDDSDFYEYKCRVELLGIPGSGRYATVEETQILPFSVCSATEELEVIKSDSDSKCVHIGKDLKLSLEKATTLYTDALQVVKQLCNVWSHSTSRDESETPLAPDHDGVWLGAENIVVGDIVMLRCSTQALIPNLDQFLPQGPGKRMRKMCQLQEYDTAYYGSSSRAVFLKINAFDFGQTQPEPSVVGDFYELVDGDHENVSRAHADAKDPQFQLLFLPINVPNNQEAMVPFSKIFGRYYRGISRSRAMAAWKTLFPISVIAESPEKWGAMWKLEGLVAADDIGDQAEDHPIVIMEYCDIARAELLEKAKNVVRRTV
ncbi:hypothetical protein VNI00_009001 [Paramarasmius palmivorus]|uniref:Uncharacterized protein n=1 Tax=Paramarasmius palmivorus TaxID=297713 RepID=A0AAW0CPD7_9AGAR